MHLACCLDNKKVVDERAGPSEGLGADAGGGSHEVLRPDPGDEPGQRSGKARRDSERPTSAAPGRRLCEASRQKPGHRRDSPSSPRSMSRQV